jgi:lipid-A-disaccharide synthase
LISEREVVPERFQEKANPSELAKCLCRFIDDPDYRRSVVYDLQALKQKLGAGGGLQMLAQTLLEFEKK